MDLRNGKTTGLQRYAKIWTRHLIGRCEIDKQERRKFCLLSIN